MFRKFNREKIESFVDYVKEYVATHYGIEVIVGSDSQNRGQYTVYSTVVAMYTPGHGGHCIYERWREPRERIRQNRLLKEVERSIKAANTLREAGIKVNRIDLDINENKKYKSSEVFSTAKGWVEGSGYECSYKTLGPLVTTMADYIVKH